MPTARPSYDKLIFELSSPGRFAYSLPACDVPESDPGAIERAGSEYLRKYRPSPYAQAMVKPEVLPTTLRHDPR